jgi:hypothetical protein
MQPNPGACDPEQLQILQEFFDTIWHRLETSGSRYVFPWDAQASREKIAIQLCRRMNDLFVDPDRVTLDILEMFDAGGNDRA